MSNAMTTRSVLALLNIKIRDAGSQQAFAKEHRLKISPQYLSEICRGNRPVPDNVLKVLGLKREIRIVRVVREEIVAK